MVDAWTDEGEEGRTRLRKATGSCQEALIRGFPNGATRHIVRCVTAKAGRTRGSETSQYPEEKKSTEILQVAASERGVGHLVIAQRLEEVSGKVHQRE